MKAVIFDMDGVIVDSEAVHIKMKIQALEEYGIACSPEECMPYFGRSSNAFFSDFIKKSAAHISLQEIVARKHQLFLQYVANDGNVNPIEGALELIHGLRRNNIPLALASSSVRSNIEWFLKKFGVFDCFDVVLSGAELSESKPNPEIYLLAAKELGTGPQECVIIEDAEAGVTAAKMAGSYCIAYCNPVYKNCGQDVSSADMLVNSLTDISAERIIGINI